MDPLIKLQARFRAKKDLHKYLWTRILKLKSIVLVLLDGVKGKTNVQDANSSLSVHRTLQAQSIATGLEEQLKLLLDLAETKRKFIESLKIAENIHSSLRLLLQMIGGIRLELILALELDMSIDSMNHWLNLLNAEFLIQQYQMFNKQDEGYVEYSKKDTRSIISKTKLRKTNLPGFMKMKTDLSDLVESKSLQERHQKHFEQITPANPIIAIQEGEDVTCSLLRFYLFVKDIHGESIYLTIAGKFKEDYFQHFQLLPMSTIQKRFQVIKQEILATSHCPKAFIERWFSILTLEDILVRSVQDLEISCSKAYFYITKTKSVLISNIIKEFLGADPNVQRDMLIAYYLSDDDSDTAYIGFMLVDLVMSDNVFSEKRKVLNDVISSIPWIIRKKILKSLDSRDMTHMRITSKLNATAENGDSTSQEPELSYESRIYLLKAPQNVKRKAFDKLKELQNRTGSDSQSKAQQYLDALLRIPFGCYKKEPIFAFLGQFKQSFIDMIDKFVSFKEKEKDTNNRDLYLFAKEKLHQKPVASLTFTDIDSFFSQMYVTNSEKPGTVDKKHPVQQQPWSLYCQQKSLDELLSIIQQLKKTVSSKMLTYTVQGKLQVIKTKTKKGNAFVASSFSEIVDMIASYMEEKKETDPSIYTRILAEVFPDFVARKERSPSITDELVDGMIHNMHLKWDKFQADRKEYLDSVHNKLAGSVYGQGKAKRTIEQMIAQWISGNGKGACFGFEGPPGTGKTSLAKRGLSNCLLDEEGQPRPFAFVALGGSTNGAFLEGHSYTYVGSLWGKIVDILMESKYMNPIIFFDELDKVSSTEHGKEIIGILTHLTDPTQNEEFMDKYFNGIKIDLSKVLFIFSYNDVTKIDPILKDRIHAVIFEPLSKIEKKEVARLHLLPEIMEVIGVSISDIQISEEVIDFIIDNYTYEGGARRLKEHLFFIVREMNLRHLSSPTSVFPVAVTVDMLKDDLFKEKALHKEKMIISSPTIGVINGMYASGIGIGGVTMIECFRAPSTTPLTLELTGNQGKVMKESMSVAKTVAWNLLSKERQELLQSEWKEHGTWGMHLHCPEGSVPKDGPSAGTAITLCILSCMLKLPISNTIAITGEIDLNGRVCQIGGLAAKVKGAKAAGVKKVFFPKDNEHDLQQILISDDNPFVPGEFDYAFADTIQDIYKDAFGLNNYDIYFA